MNEHRFDGRVAVVTGAGRGIGRAHALLLADRGASVVVNDLGGSMDGVGEDPGPAAAVAAEIVAAGGAAIADSSDVATTAGSQALVEAAVERFGRVDIVVNNAGIIRWAGFPEADLDNLERHLAVHVAGSFNTTRAAWPHMVEQGYGRVVMTTSAGLFGLPDNLSYATAKGAVIGLTRSLTTAGAAHGIKINLIAPAAMTRMAGRPDAGTDSGGGGRSSNPMASDPMDPVPSPPWSRSSPTRTAPSAARSTPRAPVASRRIFIASTVGYVHPGPEATIEDVAGNWATINDETRLLPPGRPHGLVSDVPVPPG